MGIRMAIAVMGDTHMVLADKCSKRAIEYSRHIGLISLLVFLTHMAKLNVSVIGIDTENSILGDGLYYGWLTTGRQGLVLMKYLLLNSDFNPYFSAVMTLITLVLAVSSFFLLWDKILGIKSSMIVWGAGGLLWISHPVITEQLYFSLQSFEIALGFLLTAASLYLTILWVENKRRLWAFGITVVVLVVTFSTYQAFVAIYIFGAVSVLFLQTLQELPKSKQKNGHSVWLRIASWILVFLTAFLINTLITQLFFSSSNYLGEQIRWGKVSVWDISLDICRHIIKVLSGYGMYYSIFYGLLLICSFALLLAHLWRWGRNNRINCIIVVFLYLALQATPFLMTILQGGEPVLRSQLVLPVMTCFQAMLCLWIVKGLEISMECFMKKMLIGILCLSLLAGIKTTKITWRLYYTDQMRYEQDVALGQDLIRRIDQVCQSEESLLPVVVVGTRPFQGNNSCLQGQVMGHSFFDWDATVAPIPYWSTGRVLGFLHTLGSDYTRPSADRMEEALLGSKSMPEWPAEDCVQIYNGMVIVKLSDYE